MKIRFVLRLTTGEILYGRTKVVNQDLESLADDVRRMMSKLGDGVLQVELSDGSWFIGQAHHFTLVVEEMK